MTDNSLIQNDPTESQLDIVENPGIKEPNNENGNSEWLWDTGIKGEGEIPDGFNPEKYKTVAAQAKAQRELAKKLGGFTGAPDEYKLNETKDNNSFIQVDTESEIYKSFHELAKTNGMSNDMFNSLVEMHLKNTELNTEQQEKISEESRQEEIKKLGENSTEILSEIGSWANNNLLDNELEQFRGMATTADNVKLLQKIIQKTSASKIGAIANSTPDFTRDDLRKMIGDPKYHTDMRFRKDVDNKYKQLHEAGKLNG